MAPGVERIVGPSDGKLQRLHVIRPIFRRGIRMNNGREAFTAASSQNDKTVRSDRSFSTWFGLERGGLTQSDCVEL